MKETGGLTFYVTEHEKSEGNVNKEIKRVYFAEVLRSIYFV